MAEQSQVQQLIQSLAGIQSTAQQNASNAANNGNPNTVYNTSAWGYGGPPVMDSNGLWSNNQFSPAAVLQAQSYNLGNWQAPAGSGGGVGAGGGWGGVGAVIPPNITNPDWVPTTPPATGGGGGGGTPSTGGGGTPTTGGTGTPRVTDYPLWNNPGTGGFGGVVGPRPGNTATGGGNGRTTSIGEWLTTGQGGQLLGTNPDGSIGWQQIVDLVSEPWVQGDLYMSNSGRWNPQNVVTAITNTVIPGLGSLFEVLADKGVFGENVRQWVIEGRFTEAENAMVGMMEELEAWDRADGTNHTGTNPSADLRLGDPALDPFLSNIMRGNTSLNNVLNGAAVDPNWVNNELSQWDSYQSRPGGRDNRSGRSAGSSTLAEGEAAQDLVNQWQINQWLQGSQAQARGAMERMFGGKYK